MSAGLFSQIAFGLFDIFKEEQRAEADAETLRFNAAQLERQARETLALGLFTSEQLRVQGKRQTGEAVAAVGASGVALSGSPLDAIADLSIQNEKRARAANFEAKTEARNLREAANIARRRATALDRSTTADILQRGLFDPASDFFSNPGNTVGGVF